MTFWLLQAMGDIDSDLVERAAGKPRKTHPLRWVAAVAAAAVMVTGVGVWWHNRPEDNLPIINSDTPIGDTTSTTMNNTVSTQPTTTTNGTGGDEKSCVVHSGYYHGIPIRPDAVGKEVYDTFWELYGGEKPLPDPDLTYPFTECNYPDSNIVNFVKFTGITQEEFIATGWHPDYIPSLGGIEAFLNTQFDDRALFTYGDYFDAIYGDDPHLTAWVFHHSAASVPDADYPYQYCYRLRAYPEDPLYNLEGYVSYQTYKSLSGNNESIIGFVEFAGITREKFIEVYGWGDKLDEKATDHFEYAPYTYRQFVDAIYGDDQALRDWVFDRYVFSPGYPTTP